MAPIRGSRGGRRYDPYGQHCNNDRVSNHGHCRNRGSNHGHYGNHGSNQHGHYGPRVNNNGGGNHGHYGPQDEPRERSHYEPPGNNNGGGYYGSQGHNPPEDHEQYGPQVNQRVPAAVATAAVVDDTTAGRKLRKERSLFLSARPKVYVVFPTPTVVPVAAAAAVAVSTTVDQQEPPKEPTSSLFLSRKVYVVFPETPLVPVAAAASVAVRTTVGQEWPEEPIDRKCLETGRRLRKLLESSDEAPENVKSVDKIWEMCCQWLAMDKRTCNRTYPYRKRASTNDMITAIGRQLDLCNTDKAPCEDCKRIFLVECMFEHTRDDGVERQVCGGCHGGYKAST
jgi:hypothetical protein